MVYPLQSEQQLLGKHPLPLLHMRSHHTCFLLVVEALLRQTQISMSLQDMENKTKQLEQLKAPKTKQKGHK